ncbi:hypothetical protein BAOM_2968 [Peribacillus asahii]|uniref:Uncharacterized protein n=1 Tax=Peribacillus asahii TaxID=228899 RepID=A0A3Q9RK52_9BACI|nr:hypothetical protein [Peribacillus asahii]AZV43577.1 hypothetical protein BAOM_2968 [Peribacillus asahii]
MEIKQFEGFRFSVDDRVIIKDTDTAGVISQCRYEIVSNKTGELIVEENYMVKYGGYSQKKCKVDEIKYQYGMEPEVERVVLSVLIDVELMRKNFGRAAMLDKERNEIR